MSAGLVDQVKEFIANHMISVGLAIFFLVRYCLGGGGGGKFEEFPGNKVIAIKDRNMFTDAIVAAKQNNQLVVVDFYATWCPPCRRANPIIGKMSIDYPNALFLKVNVDECRDLTSEYGVRAMPTFKLLTDEKKEYGEVVGFDEAKLKRMVENYKPEK